MNRRSPGSVNASGSCSKTPGLFPDKTVYENVAVSLRVSGDGRASELVWDAAGSRAAGRSCRTLPGAAFGAVRPSGRPLRGRLSGSPQLLLADEPTANLPPAMAWQVLQVLTDIHYYHGVTTIIATHDREVVDRMRQRVVELSHGYIVRDQRGGRFAA